MAKYSLSVHSDPLLPGAQGVKITWTSTTEAAPPGMRVRIENGDDATITGQNKYGGWVASTPKAPATLNPPVNGWASMNPTGVVAANKEFPINLVNGSAYIFPTYQIGGVGDWKYYNTISITTEENNPPTAEASGQLRGATGLTITIIGGGGGPE